MGRSTDAYTYFPLPMLKTDGQKFRPEAIQKGGKAQFPYLEGTYMTPY